MAAKKAKPLAKLAIIGDEEAALAGGHIFVGKEGKASDVPECSQFAAIPARRANGVCGVLDDPEVKLYGAEAGGHGIDTENCHAASMTGGRPGVLHGNRTYLLQDKDGQILEGHSISAGLDYPGVGPEHAFLHDSKRVTYQPITDKEALEAFQLLTRTEGIIPALESAHGLAQVMKIAPTMGKDTSIVLCLSGRGDKDVESVGNYLGLL